MISLFIRPEVTQPVLQMLVAVESNSSCTKKNSSLNVAKARINRGAFRFHRRISLLKMISGRKAFSYRVARFWNSGGHLGG